MKKLIYFFYSLIAIIGVLACAFGFLVFLMMEEGKFLAFVIILLGFVLCIPWISKHKQLQKEHLEKSKKPDSPKADKQDTIDVPRILGDAWLHYHYTLSFVLENLNLALSMNEANDFSLDYEIDADRVILLHKSEVLGYTTERLKMFKDWKKYNNPLLIYLYKVDEDAGVYEIFVAFYEDERKQQSWRDQTVFTLTNYKSKEVQFNLLWVATEKTIAVDIDTDDEGHYCVYNDGSLLGRVPAKYSNRFEEEYYTLAVIESLDRDEDSKYIPVIRVYW